MTYQLSFYQGNEAHNNPSSYLQKAAYATTVNVGLGAIFLKVCEHLRNTYKGSCFLQQKQHNSSLLGVISKVNFTLYLPDWLYQFSNMKLMRQEVHMCSAQGKEFI